MYFLLKLFYFNVCICIFQRLKNWEARERKKAREYEKEREREEDRKQEEVGTCSMIVATQAKILISCQLMLKFTTKNGFHKFYLNKKNIYLTDLTNFKVVLSGEFILIFVFNIENTFNLSTRTGNGYDVRQKDQIQD